MKELLDNTKRELDSKTVRSICTGIRHGEEIFYGNDLSNNTWAEYRKLAGIKGKPKFLTRLEAFKLMTCARLHKSNYRNVTKELIEEQMLTIPNSSTFNDFFDKMIVGSTVLGKEIPELIRTYKEKNISEKTLYRWGKEGITPKYHTRKKYNAVELRRFLEAA